MPSTYCSSKSVEEEARESLLSTCLSQCPKEKFLKPNRKLSVTSINTTQGGGPMLTLLTKDHVRDLNVPRTGAQHMTALINPEKYEQLKATSYHISKEEEEAIQEEKRKKRDELKEASDARKKQFEAWDVARKKNEKLNELEEEAKQKMEYLRQKADMAAQERNQEIKEINQLILNAKVQAIRDAQVSEKQLIEYEHKQAERELDNMMEKIRIEGVKREREKVEKRKVEAHQSAAGLQEQIKSNFQNRLLVQERKVREGEELLKKLDENQQKEFQDLKEKKLKQQHLLESLRRDNAALLKQRETMKYISEKEDQMIAEYQRLKAEKEEAKEIVAKEAKRKRELEITKLKEQQEKASDIKAEQDALRARRAQEEQERRYRMLEKEKAIKNAEIQESLKKSRNEQLIAQERYRRSKAAAEQKELSVQMKKLKDAVAKEESKKLEKKIGNLKHSEEIRNQIMNKEREKINERKELFNEGIHKQQEEKHRRELLDVLKKQKLAELRKFNIPETYITHIKRQVNLKEKE